MPKKGRIAPLKVFSLIALIYLSLSLSFFGCQKSDSNRVAAIGFSAAPLHNELKQSGPTFDDSTKSVANPIIEKIKLKIFSDPDHGVTKILDQIERTHSQFREDPKLRDCLTKEGSELQPFISLLHDFQPKLNVSCRYTNSESTTQILFGYKATSISTLFATKAGNSGTQSLTLVTRETVPEVQVSLVQIRKQGEQGFSYLIMKLTPAHRSLAFSWASNASEEDPNNKGFAWNSNAEMAMQISAPNLSVAPSGLCYNLSDLSQLATGQCQEKGLSRFPINLVTRSDLDLPAVQAKLNTALQYHW